jgi:hypothetical protein
MSYRILGSPAFPVLSNKEKAVRAGLLPEFVPDQYGKDDILGKNLSIYF